MKIILSLALAGLMALPALAQETRLYVDDQGHEVQIPVDPQRIVALRDEFLSAPLIELDANLVGSTGLVNDKVNGGAPYVRGAFDALDFRFETSEVAYLGDSNEYDLEAIAKAEPDLILLMDNRSAEYDQLSLIAPTVVMRVWGQSTLDLYRKIADVSNRLPAYEQMLGLYEERVERAIATVTDSVGDPASVSVAVASGREDGMQVYRDNGVLGQVLRDIGFTMPEFIAGQEEAEATVSIEMIHEIDADFMIDTYWTARGDTPRQMQARWDAVLPGWRDELHAARHNQYFMINREEMRAVSFTALRSILEIVVSQIATRDFVPLGSE